MAKIKVHNLAAEVGRTNREIIDYLTSKGYGPITAVTAVPENEVANIREMFGAKPASPDTASKTGDAAGTGKGDAQDADGDKAKRQGSGFVRVYRSQNASKQLQRRPKKAAAPSRQGEQVSSPSSGAAVKSTPKPARSDADARTDVVPDKTLAQVPVTNAAEERSAVKETQAGTLAGTVSPETVKTASTPEKAVSTSEKVISNPDKAAPASAPTAEKQKPAVMSGNSSAPAERDADSALSSRNDAKKPSEEKPVPKTSAAASSQTSEKSSSSAVSSQTAVKASPDNTSAERSQKGQKTSSARKPETTKTQKSQQGKTSSGDAKKPASAQPGKPASAQPGKSATKTSDDSGFHNGRIIRSYGAAARTSSFPTRGRNGRTGTSRDGQAARSGERRPSAAGSDRSGRGNRSDRSYSSTGGRGQFSQGARTGSGTGRSFTQSRPGGGQGGFGGRGGRPGAGGASQGSDNTFSRKTTRTYRSDAKDRDRAREDRRELGHGRGDSFRQNGGRNLQGRGSKSSAHKGGSSSEKKAAEVVTEIRVPDRITVRDLADKMKLNAAQIVKELFLKGTMVTVNHELTYEQAEEIALDHDILCEKEEKEDVIGELLAEKDEDEEDMVPRPPVVVVMGHVDHGKTSLLDAIRNTHVTDREAGGITQHIGAYMVSINGQKITFLDTPGHEAFTAMRMRGANATDIAVLVVAADDGVMPQTVEAINHAKAAKVEIIVAINKIDKPGANVDRVKQELSEYGLVAEDWGGSTVFCPVSAKTHEGLDNLLEMILLTSEVMELKANPNRKARGIVLEAKLDKGRGPVASILIQKGTLHQGDYVACGAAHGKVRAMTDENGKRLHSATPSMPVEITGLSEVPEAGEVLVGMDSDKEARDFASVFVAEGKKSLVEETRHQMSLDDLFKEIKEGDLKELPIVVKADVQGSVEAVSQSLIKLSNDEVVVKVIHSGVGAISESDVSLAAASGAIIIGFNVRPDATAKLVAEQQKVDIRIYNVIYEAIDAVERALKGMRAAVYEEQIQGHAEIRQIFKASGVGNIAGAYVKDGIIARTSKVRVFRRDEKLWEGELSSLKRFKDDVKEVREGFECGIVFDGFGDFAVDDTVEAYTMVQVEQD